VLIRSIFKTKVLQGSVSTRLRCDGIVNDQFITQSLLSTKVKNFENRSTFAEVMGNLVRGGGSFVFMKHGVEIRYLLATSNLLLEGLFIPMACVS